MSGTKSAYSFRSRKNAQAAKVPPVDPLAILDSESDELAGSTDENALPFNNFDYRGSLVVQQQAKRMTARQEKRYIKQGKFINKFMQELSINDHFDTL
mgnify:CR=1 FL=1